MEDGLGVPGTLRFDGRSRGDGGELLIHRESKLSVYLVRDCGCHEAQVGPVCWPRPGKWGECRLVGSASC